MKTSARWWSLLALVLIGVCAASIWKYLAPSHSESSLPALGGVQDFALIDQSHAPVTRQKLLGNIWIADFIYTTCGGQCPLMSQKMAKIQSLLPKESAIQLVSISVDPEHDTPPVLTEYAKRYHADPARWRFATGSPKAIHELAENFKLASAGESSDAFVLNHSDRLILVDGRAQIRGYYDGTDEKDVQRLMTDVSALSSEETR